MSFTSLYGSYLELVQLLQTEVSAITTIYISILKHLFPLLDRIRKKMFMQPNDSLIFLFSFIEILEQSYFFF